MKSKEYVIKDILYTSLTGKMKAAEVAKKYWLKKVERKCKDQDRSTQDDDYEA